MDVTATVSTNATTLTQAPILHTAVRPGALQGEEATRADKQCPDSPVLPKRQARMALNAITNRRKGAALPSMPPLQPKAKEEGDISKTSKFDKDLKTVVPRNIQQLASSEQITSPKLPPPNKRKTSILKDGIYSKLENKNVTINEITNIKHHYDPLENVRTDKKKGEQTLMDTKVEDGKYKSTGEYGFQR